jgi:nitrite reductase/ring-hydroxylating ferredoxin subunit
MRVISRREFIKLTGATALCTCAGAGISACSNSAAVSSIPLAPEGSYRREGDRVVVSLTAAELLNRVRDAVRLTIDGGGDEGLKIVIVHLDGGAFRAFADWCTHGRKELDYLLEDRKLLCRSGKSHFDLEGNVIKGPAASALLAYPARRDGDRLVLEV